MNRKERRKFGRYADAAARLECPDCASTVELEAEIEPGLANMVTRHSPSCPWLAAYRRAGGTGVRLRVDDDPDDAA